jgi:hypothetical protein
MHQTLAAAFYPYARHPFRQLLSIVEGMTRAQRTKLLETYTGNRQNRRQRPGRALEHGYPLTFDLQADFGAYRDLQRHRILTQERQLLHPFLGYELPPELKEVRFEEQAQECFARSADLYAKMLQQFGPEVAQYVVLFGYKIRWRMGMNFREAMHMIELRTAPQGHPSYRKVCQQMLVEIRKAHPELASTITFADFKEYYWSRAESEARQRRKERDVDTKFAK